MTAIIMAGATVVAYIIGEGLVDAAATNQQTDQSKKDDVTIEKR